MNMRDKNNFLFYLELKKCSPEFILSVQIELNNFLRIMDEIK